MLHGPFAFVFGVKFQVPLVLDKWLQATAAKGRWQLTVLNQRLVAANRAQLRGESTGEKWFS